MMYLVVGYRSDCLEFDVLLRAFQRKNRSCTAHGARKALWNRRAHCYMFTSSIGREHVTVVEPVR